MQKNNPKTEKFDIRLSLEEQELAAQTVIRKNNCFVISDKQWQVMERVLNRKAKVLPNLRKRLSGSDEWDT